MSSAIMPALFIGHGSPMNAIKDSAYTRAWHRLAAELPFPEAILVVSAHWYTRGTAVTAMERPRTIHDFYGFPAELFACQYPAPGDPALAAQVATMLAPQPVGLDEAWGLDHGAWSVLLHLYPVANIPVLQLSIDAGLSPEQHFELARRLQPLRDRGVLVLGTGNVVHNLRRMQRDAHAPAAAWAQRFNDFVRQAVLAGDDQALIHYDRQGQDALNSVPTVEHYLPLLYVLAQRRVGDEVSAPIDGIDLGAISMLSVQVGATARHESQSG
jgi:4,5-DOPA dioxygenase extradiol